MILKKKLNLATFLKKKVYKGNSGSKLFKKINACEDFRINKKEKATKLSFVGKQNSLNLCKILHHSLEIDTFRYSF